VSYKVLIFPYNSEIGNEIISSLKNNKTFKMIFASSDINNYSIKSNFHIQFLPYVYEDDFEVKLVDLIKENNIDFIFPAHDDVCLKLSEIQEKLSTSIIGQSLQTNQIVRFKNRTYQYLYGLVPIGKTYDKLEEVEKFPIFVKPVRGQGSIMCEKLNSFHELISFFESHKFEEFVIMEYLPGREFTVDCFSDNGKVIFSGARTRDRTVSGISKNSSSIKDNGLKQIFNKFSDLISHKLNMHGVWFYQMKEDLNGQPKLLEVGPRISGTMCVNRAKGINFVEAALYQKLGYKINVSLNDIDISVNRKLETEYFHNIQYSNLYIDFDDTLFLEEKFINPEIMKLIFHAKNNSIKIYLITKNTKQNLTCTLQKFGIPDIFDEIIHINQDDKKYLYMESNSILIDDSFRERQEAIENGFMSFGLDNIGVLN